MGLLLCIVTFATMLAMSGSTEIGIVSSEFESDAPHVIPAGETETQTFELSNAGVLPVVTVAESASSGVTVDQEPTTLHRGESTNATVGVSAPPETGYYLESFEEFRYFGVLPTPVVAWLHGIHPWIAMLATTSVIVGVFVLPFAVLLGTGSIRTRTRTRSDPTKSIF